MNAQVKGNSFSIALHVVLLLAFWSANAHQQIALPPMPLELSILHLPEAAEQGDESSAETAPPEAQEILPPPAPVETVAIKPLVRKKPVEKKREQAKQEAIEQPPKPVETPRTDTPVTGQSQTQNPAKNTNQTARQGAARSGVYSPGEIDGSLNALKRTQPAYPASARRRNIEGWVQVQFIVNEYGQPEQIRVLAADPEGIFDSSVINSIGHWRFRPGTINGTAVRVLVEQTIRFQLR
jgi:protein TonB